MSVVLFDAFLIVGETLCPSGVEEIMGAGMGVLHPEMKALALKCAVETGEVTLRFDTIFDGLLKFSRFLYLTLLVLISLRLLEVSIFALN